MMKWIIYAQQGLAVHIKLTPFHETLNKGISAVMLGSR